ncbi:MAG: hypothetical protein IT211_04740 [Armatimonadetes bacterium]|nr:hypothetical protein [Armatimonadota bacterium]
MNKHTNRQKITGVRLGGHCEYPNSMARLWLRFPNFATEHHAIPLGATETPIPFF